MSSTTMRIRTLMVLLSLLAVSHGQSVWDGIHSFLSSGDLQKGSDVLDTLREMQTKGNHDLDTMSAALHRIHETSLNYTQFEIAKHRFFNLSNEFNDTYEYDIGVEAVDVTRRYIALLMPVTQSVQDIDAILLAREDTLHGRWTSNFPKVQDCEQWLQTAERVLAEETENLSRLEAELVFRDYVDPVIYLLILGTGLVWNLMLLLMFARRREVRTPANIMIFNIVMVDFLNLIFNLPLQYLGYYYPQYVRLSVPVCVLFVTLRCMFTSASALSVVALSAQRYCATLPAFHNIKARTNLSSLVITVLYIMLVWAGASSIVLPDTLGDKVCDDQPIGKSGRKSAKIVTLHEFLIYCFALPFLMFVFTVLTARRLRANAKIPGDAQYKAHEDARHRGAKVVMALCIVFTISYVPFFMWGRIATVLALDRFKVPYKILDNITYYLLFSNPCFNPLALYVTSHTFRRLFNVYFLGWCRRGRVLVRTDTQISYDTTQSTPQQQDSDM